MICPGTLLALCLVGQSIAQHLWGLFSVSLTHLVFFSLHFYFPGVEKQGTYISFLLTENNKDTAKLQEIFFLQLGKRTWTSAVALNTFLCICVWCLNVMCEEYLAPSNLLNPKERTFDCGTLHCIRVLGSQKELWSLGFQGCSQVYLSKARCLPA